MCCNGDVQLVISCHHGIVSLKLHQSPIRIKRRDGEVRDMVVLLLVML